MTTKCTECGASMEAAENQTVPFPAGVPGVLIEGVTVYTCPSCGDVVNEYPPLEPSLRALTRMIATRPGKLQGPEVRFLRKRLGFSGQDFARYFCVAEETASRWQSGVHPMDPFKDKTLRLLALNGPLHEDYGADIDPDDPNNPPKREVYVVDFEAIQREAAAAAEESRQRAAR